MSHLHLVLSRDKLPHTLMRERLARRAAEACVAFSGRPEKVGELRDAVAVLQLDYSPGPAGEVYLLWQRAPVRRAATALQAVVKDRPARPCHGADPSRGGLWRRRSGGAMSCPFW